MKFNQWYAFVIGVLVTAVVAWAAMPTTPSTQVNAPIAMGMSADQVRHLKDWGEPDLIRTYASTTGTYQEWRYHTVWNCRRYSHITITNGKVTAIRAECGETVAQ